jgi:hypothetical protein
VDTILEDGVASQSDQVSFTKLAGGGYVLPKDQTVVFEVHGDIASSLTGDDLQLRFDTGSSVTYLEAEKLADGSSLSGLKLNGTCSSTCNITVVTVASIDWFLKGQGDLFVTLDSQTVSPRQLLAGSLGEPILRMKFHAENEDIDVTDLVVNSSGGAANSIEALELWLDGATRALATSGGCGSADVLSRNADSGLSTSTTGFCFSMDNRQFVIPKGTDVRVNVRPRLKTDVQGATSADVLALFIDHTEVSNDSTGTGSVRARGVASSNNLAANDKDSLAEGEVFIGRAAAATSNLRIVGNYNNGVLSKIVTIANAGPASGSVPSGADQQIASFTFTAAANANSKNGLNQAVLSGVVFTVNATNVEMAAAGFKIYNKVAGASTNSACTPFSTAGAAIVGDSVGSGVFLVKCNGTTAGLSGVINTTIDSGASITLVLLANVTDTNAAAGAGGTSLLQVSMNGFSDVVKKTFGHASNQSRVQWRDYDSGTAAWNAGAFTWIEYPDTAINSTTYHG